MVESFQITLHPASAPLDPRILALDDKCGVDRHAEKNKAAKEAGCPISEEQISTMLEDGRSEVCRIPSAFRFRVDDGASI